MQGTLRLVRSRSRWIFSYKSRDLIRSHVIFAENTPCSHRVLTHSFRCSRKRHLCNRIGPSDGLIALHPFDGPWPFSRSSRRSYRSFFHVSRVSRWFISSVVETRPTVDIVVRHNEICRNYRGYWNVPSIFNINSILSYYVNILKIRCNLDDAFRICLRYFDRTVCYYLAIVTRLLSTRNQHERCTFRIVRTARNFLSFHRLECLSYRGTVNWLVLLSNYIYTIRSVFFLIHIDVALLSIIRYMKHRCQFSYQKKITKEFSKDKEDRRNFISLCGKVRVIIFKA